MNELMKKKKIDACNSIMIFGAHGRSFQSFSLIKSWVQNQVSIEGKKFKAGLLTERGREYLRYVDKASSNRQVQKLIGLC